MDEMALEKIESEAQIANPSAMVSRPGPILRWLGRAFFGAVAFDERHRETIRKAAQAGTIVYVQQVRSLLDLLYFNHAFITYALPLVFFAAGLNLLLFRPIGEVIRYLWRRLFGSLRQRPKEGEMLRYGLTSGKACLIALKKPPSLIQWGEDDRLGYLRDIVEVQMALERPIILVPLLVVWDKKPETYRRTIFDVVFGDPQAPGRLRKLISFLLNFRRARAQVGRPINLREFIEANPDAEGIDALAARLKFALSKEFLLDTKAIRGPVLKGAKQIVDEIMRTPPFIERILEIANKEGIPPEAALQRAHRQLLHIAADFRFNWTEGLGLALTVVFQRLFTGVVIDTEGLNAIREAARTAPIVLVPAHRSHIDYLLISLMFYTHGLIPPHIAAGENLSFWPMGPIFRHSGAFFIRRSFKGDELYKTVLSFYIRKLLKEGYWVEFFIEGTRSRSGKSLSPRYGILSMVVEAVASGAAPDAYLVPCAVTYEKVIEEKSYRAEYAGHEKRRESVLELAKSARALKTRYGQAYLQFEKPISLVAFLKSQGLSLPLEQGTRVPDEVIRRLGHILVHKINQCLLVTPHHLVAFALMTHRKRGIERERLLERVGFIMAYLLSRRARLTDPLRESLAEMGLLEEKVDGHGLVGGRDDERPRVEAFGFALQRHVDDVLRAFHKEKAISVISHGEDVVISVTEEGRIALDYYKNGIIHFFVTESILATAVLLEQEAEGRPFPLERLAERTKGLSRVFKFEFIFGADETYEAIFSNTLAKFCAEGLLGVQEGVVEIRPSSREVLDFFASITAPFFEAYKVVGLTVLEHPSEASEKEIVKAALKKGRKMYLVGDIHYIEAVSAVTFRNALTFLGDEVAKGRAPNVREAAKAMLETLGVKRG